MRACFFFQKCVSIRIPTIFNLCINNFPISSIQYIYIYCSFPLFSSFFFSHEMIRNYPDRQSMTTQVRVNAENIYTEILSITRRHTDRDNDIFQDNIPTFRFQRNGALRKGKRLGRAWNNTLCARVLRPVVCMTGRLIREAIFYSRGERDVKCNAMTQRQQREKQTSRRMLAHYI